MSTKQKKAHKARVDSKVLANRAKLIKQSKADELMNISKLECDSDIYPRTSLVDNRVNIYKDAMRNGDIFPAIIVESRNGKPTGRILDGWHRYEAYRQLDRTDIPVKYLETKDEIDAIRQSFLYNMEHGLPYTSIEIKQYVRTAEELGITYAVISKDINKPEKKVVSITKGFGISTTGKTVALKRGFGHLAKAKRVTKSQIQLMRKWSGGTPTIKVRELTGFFQSGAYIGFKEMDVLTKEMDKLTEEWLEVKKLLS